MLKQLDRCKLTSLLEKISVNYDLQVPIILADGTRQLGRYAGGPIELTGKKLQRKPTSYFFPQTELMLTMTETGEILSPPDGHKPLALCGLDRADLAALKFLDRFFGAPPADDLYLRRRQGALLIGVTGFAGPEGEFLPVANGDCDVELIATGQDWLAVGYSAAAPALLNNFTDAAAERLTSFQQSSAVQSTVQEKLHQASRLLQEEKVPDSFWEEIATRCILCCGCNLACPTCSCFCVQDRKTVNGTERSRVWDSCQLDAFMREASGHNPLGTEALRTRRRIHHKLVADVVRWGELGCVACGRCDRACPTGIGMLAVVDEIVARFA